MLIAMKAFQLGCSEGDYCQVHFYFTFIPFLLFIIKRCLVAVIHFHNSFWNFSSHVAYCILIG